MATVRELTIFITYQQNNNESCVLIDIDNILLRETEQRQLHIYRVHFVCIVLSILL